MKTLGEIAEGKHVRYYDYFRRTELVVRVLSHSSRDLITVRDTKTGATFVKPATTEIIEEVAAPSHER